VKTSGEKWFEIMDIFFKMIDVFTLIVLLLTLWVNKLTRDTINKERFESTFFKLFETLHKLLTEITAKQPKHIDKWPTMKNISEVEMACSEDIYSPRLRQFFDLLFQILKYIDKNGIKDKTIYIDIIRPLLSQEILSLLKSYEDNDNKKLIEKYLVHS
jgi:hypothetical protein